MGSEKIALIEMNVPGCFCTCFHSPRPDWPWWCSSHRSAGCTAAATGSSSWTRRRRSVCASVRRRAGWSRRPRRRKRCWSLMPSRSWNLFPRCPGTTAMCTPRTGQSESEAEEVVKKMAGSVMDTLGELLCFVAKTFKVSSYCWRCVCCRSVSSQRGNSEFHRRSRRL